MKIYNKKNFFIGLFGELLFIALLVFNIRRGEASFLYVCTALMWLAIGGRIIFRSLSLKHSREDLLLERDERNRHINLKASQRALQITQILSFIGGMVLYGLGGDDYKHLMLGTGLLLAFFISGLAYFAAISYYSHNS